MVKMQDLRSVFEGKTVGYTTLQGGQFCVRVVVLLISAESDFRLTKSVESVNFSKYRKTCSARFVIT
jgi:hypothetical protein